LRKDAVGLSLATASAIIEACIVNGKTVGPEFSIAKAFAEGRL
jgi:hypothetical protein